MKLSKAEYEAIIDPERVFQNEDTLAVGRSFAASKTTPKGMAYREYFQHPDKNFWTYSFETHAQIQAREQDMAMTMAQIEKNLAKKR